MSEEGLSYRCKCGARYYGEEAAAGCCAFRKLEWSP